MNSNETEIKPTFLKTHSAAIRIWHWLLFLLISGSMLTVLLNSTILKARNNISLVQDQLVKSGIKLSSDQARGVAHEFSDRIWLVHKVIGYIVVFFLISRLLIEFTQPSSDRFINRLRKAAGFYKNADTKEMKKFGRHFLLVRYGYLFFYCLLLLMGLTGLVLAYEDVEFLKPIHELSKFLHGYGQYAMYAYILLHIGGVVLAELGSEKGLVSGMINGNETVKESKVDSPA